MPGISQQRILSYKHIVDTKLKDYFDSSLTKQMKCKVSSLIESDSTEVFFTRNYVPNQNDKEIFLTITFTYSFFSKSINHWFAFDMTISKDKNKISDLLAIEEIPSCIRYNKECGFIKKDSAVEIAMADSIAYPNNLSIQFIRPIYKKEYYWYITGHPKEIQQKGARRTTTRRMAPNQRKIINAQTGNIVSWQEYTKPN